MDASGDTRPSLIARVRDPGDEAEAARLMYVVGPPGWRHDGRESPAPERGGNTGPVQAAADVGGRAS
jgi:hypothetical protein